MTSLYRKKTFTGLYTDFASLALDKYKNDLISVLIYRAFHICSSYKNFHDEIVRIKEILFKNSFPRALTDPSWIKDSHLQQKPKRPYCFAYHILAGIVYR